MLVHVNYMTYLDMEGSGHLIAALCLHGFNFSAMKSMKGQVLNFVILLQEKKKSSANNILCNNARKQAYLTFLKKKWFAR